MQVAPVPLEGPAGRLQLVARVGQVLLARPAVGRLQLGAWVVQALLAQEELPVSVAAQAPHLAVWLQT